MKVCDYIVDVLVQHGTTDAFGIPGAVLLDLLYAMQRRSPAITPHLCYHEQGAGFAACGYAQVSGRLGVAYGTRGPGFTNLVTSIADAYADSIPVLFITAHTALAPSLDMRIQVNQEIDTCQMISGITKYAKRVDTAEELVVGFHEACNKALQGRRGPVFLDIASKLWDAEVPEMSIEAKSASVESISAEDIVAIELALNKSKRPIVLIGDGINQTDLSEELKALVDKWKIPVLSSRYAHHTIAKNSLYYGYIGCFGLRYANFILSKTDLIISLGNRLNFPLNSKSYGHLPQQAKFIRLEVDEAEFERAIPNSINIRVDLKDALETLNMHDWSVVEHSDWFEVCNTLRDELMDADMDGVPVKIAQLLKSLPKGTSVINDVGNNEFWVSRACANVRHEGKVLYSKNFATMGNALPKAIGVYYATRKPVVCFMGDQGFQLNSQELQTIAQNQLPILVVVMNNHTSGMIRDKEKAKYESYLHATKESGYAVPDLAKLAEAYGLRYAISIESTKELTLPMLMDLMIDSDISLRPYLPIGNMPQNMMPMLEEELHNRLEVL